MSFNSVNTGTNEPMWSSVPHTADNHSSTTYSPCLCLTVNPPFLPFFFLLLSTVDILQTPYLTFYYAFSHSRDYSFSHSKLTSGLLLPETSLWIYASSLAFLVNTLQCFLSSQDEHFPWSGKSLPCPYTSLILYSCVPTWNHFFSYPMHFPLLFHQVTDFSPANVHLLHRAFLGYVHRVSPYPWTQMWAPPAMVTVFASKLNMRISKQ